MAIATGRCQKLAGHTIGVINIAEDLPVIKQSLADIEILQ